MKHVYVFFILFLTTGVCYAEDIAISADVDRQEITLGSRVTLAITVSGDVSNMPQPDIPDFKDFTFYSSGRSQNLSIINGKVSSSVVFTYILEPKNTGDYSIGPFSINYKGSVYSSGIINIKVLPASAQAQALSQPDAQPSESLVKSDARPRTGKEIFIETRVDKFRAYVNEQITLTFALYQAVNLFDNPVYSPPVVTGFWTEDMPPQKKYYKVIDDVRYMVTEIKTALFATSPGEFTVGPARLEAALENMDNVSRDPFDMFDHDPFSMFRGGKPVSLQTDPIKLEILPLPEQNKPVDFKGDVGVFDISMDIDKNAVENQPVNLKIKIKGKGNIKTITSPVLPDIQDIKLYDSGNSENILKDNYIIQGHKVFEKMIIPKKPGSFTVGPLIYVYFDPVLKDYIYKKLDPVTINVEKSKDENLEKTDSPSQAVLKEEVRLLKNDIAYIKTSSARFICRDNFLYKNKLFLLINIFPLLILIVFYLIGLYKDRLRTDIGYARSLRARGFASKRLKLAGKMADKNMVKEFYTEIYKAVIEYIADKLNIPHSSITKDSLEEKLKEAGAMENIISEVKILFDDCDMARFASANFTKDDMARALKQAGDVISGLERHI